MFPRLKIGPGPDVFYVFQCDMMGPGRTLVKDLSCQGGRRLGKASCQKLDSEKCTIGGQNEDSGKFHVRIRAPRHR